jgi:hypothetical protein
MDVVSVGTQKFSSGQDFIVAAMSYPLVAYDSVDLSDTMKAYSNYGNSFMESLYDFPFRTQSPFQVPAVFSKNVINEGFGSEIHRYFRVIGGVELDLPPRR